MTGGISVAAVPPQQRTEQDVKTLKVMIEVELKLLGIMIEQAFNQELTNLKTVKTTASPN